MMFNLASIFMSGVLLMGATAIGNFNALNNEQLRDRSLVKQAAAKVANQTNIAK